MVSGEYNRLRRNPDSQRTTAITDCAPIGVTMVLAMEARGVWAMQITRPEFFSSS
jgi:hypothetical protein